MEIAVVNLILAVIIFVLGVWAFFKRKADLALSRQKSGRASSLDKAAAIPGVSLYIGLAFGLFAVSHSLTLAGLAGRLEAFVITIRIIGYLLVIVAPARVLLKK